MTGRVTIVVGGTSGIGLAAAEQLATRGDTLVLVARDGAAFGPALESVRAAGAASAECVAADVGDPADVDRVVRDVLDRHERIDAVVHTATVMASARSRRCRATPSPRSSTPRSTAPPTWPAPYYPSCAARAAGCS